MRKVVDFVPTTPGQPFMPGDLNQLAHMGVPWIKLRREQALDLMKAFEELSLGRLPHEHNFVVVAGPYEKRKSPSKPDRDFLYYLRACTGCPETHEIAADRRPRKEE